MQEAKASAAIVLPNFSRNYSSLSIKWVQCYVFDFQWAFLRTGRLANVAPWRFKCRVFFHLNVSFSQEYLYQIANDSTVEYYDFKCEVHTENPRTIVITNASAALAGE